MLFDKPLCFVDIETTGTSVTHDRIIEVGMLKVVENEIIDTYESLINPNTHVSPFITSITGIAPSDLEDAPSFEAIYPEIYKFLEGSIFVAHNARFDYGFIRQEFGRFEISYSSPLLCTVRLSRLLYPRHKRHNLDSIIERFNINCERRHRALDDSRVMFEFFTQAQQSFPIETIEKAVNTILKKPSLPVNVSNAILDDLPQTPGVYIFYGESDTPLYVGKSTNIRNRVMSHFTSDGKSTKEMNIAQQLRRVETIQTAGELGALIKEARLVKEMQPTYNRMLRVKREITVLTKLTDEHGYDRVTIESHSAISQDQLDKILAVCKTKRQAKELLVSLCKEHSLCENLMGVSKGTGSCFSSKLGICKGACAKKELPLKYNMRFLQAFFATKIKRWPFEGPIQIVEESTGKAEVFEVDHWCLVGESDGVFDYDTYKILARFILDDKNQGKIKVHEVSAQNSESLALYSSP